MGFLYFYRVCWKKYVKFKKHYKLNTFFLCSIDNIHKTFCFFVWMHPPDAILLCGNFVWSFKVVSIYLVLHFSPSLLKVVFLTSKREHLWNKEKCFLFHLEISLHSWDNQIFTFQIFKCHDVIKRLSKKQETHIIE